MPSDLYAVVQGHEPISSTFRFTPTSTENLQTEAVDTSARFIIKGSIHPAMQGSIIDGGQNSSTLFEDKKSLSQRMQQAPNTVVILAARNVLSSMRKETTWEILCYPQATRDG